jgi:hypothetical protein
MLAVAASDHAIYLLAEQLSSGGACSIFVAAGSCPWLLACARSGRPVGYNRSVAATSSELRPTGYWFRPVGVFAAPSNLMTCYTCCDNQGAHRSYRCLGAIVTRTLHRALVWLPSEALLFSLDTASKLHAWDVATVVETQRPALRPFFPHAAPALAAAPLAGAPPPRSSDRVMAVIFLKVAMACAAVLSLWCDYASVYCYRSPNPHCSPAATATYVFFSLPNCS